MPAKNWFGLEKFTQSLDGYEGTNEGYCAAANLKVEDSFCKWEVDPGAADQCSCGSVLLIKELIRMVC